MMSGLRIIQKFKCALHMSISSQSGLYNNYVLEALGHDAENCAQNIQYKRTALRL